MRASSSFPRRTGPADVPRRAKEQRRSDSYVEDNSLRELCESVHQKWSFYHSALELRQLNSRQRRSMAVFVPAARQVYRSTLAVVLIIESLYRRQWITSLPSLVALKNMTALHRCGSSPLCHQQLSENIGGCFLVNLIIRERLHHKHCINIIALFIFFFFKRGSSLSLLGIGFSSLFKRSTSTAECWSWRRC